MRDTGGCSRRQFLRALSAAPVVSAVWPAGAEANRALLAPFDDLSASERKRLKIRDVQVLVLQGSSRTYTLVKTTSDAGLTSDTRTHHCSSRTARASPTCAISSRTRASR
jgi:hypothetical protein